MVRRGRVFARGDIVEITLDPVLGREQNGKRPVLVLSPQSFNALAGIALAAPITQGGEWARNAGFAVSLSGTGLKTQGVVLWHQLATFDLAARSARFIENAPSVVVNDVLDRAKTLLEDE
jgi:mRNA interferase ChpB